MIIRAFKNTGPFSARPVIDVKAGSLERLFVSKYLSGSVTIKIVDVEQQFVEERRRRLP